MPNLYKHCEVDHNNSGCKEQAFLTKQLIVQQHDQREGNSTPQSTVRHDEAVDASDGHQAQLVGQTAQQNHACTHPTNSISFSMLCTQLKCRITKHKLYNKHNIGVSCSGMHTRCRFTAFYYSLHV